MGVIPFLMLTCGAPEAAAEEYGDLPKPPQTAPAVENTMYYLTLIVNGVSDRQVVPVQYIRGHFSVESGVLAKNHVHIGTQRSGWVDVNALPEVKVYYDSGNQSLNLTVPLEWLPEQSANSGEMVKATKAQSTPGLAFNYDAYYFKGYQSSQSVTTWLEQRLFNDYASYPTRGPTHTISATLKTTAVTKDICATTPFGVTTISTTCIPFRRAISSVIR
ncbi:hypothetical protein AU509_09750 [Lonsdalea britannica]|nr:hypothetical protein AU509_09750 [Lonsdalea britannica]